MEHIIIIIMIDETDKIRSSGENEPSVNSAIKFFNENLPVLETTRCSYIFVMNDQYDTEQFRTQIMDRVSPMMKVPSFSKKESIQKIIEKRIQAACGDVSFDEVWEEFTIDLLFDYYSKNSLRTLMQLCNLSVQNAKSDGSETISLAHIENARLDITS